jgi:O-antigen/teichoic acid export membrane protein
LRSLSEKAGWLVASNAFKYAVGIGLQVALVRILTKADYGSYQQLLLVGSITVGLLSLGLPGSVYYFVHRVSRERAGALVGQTILLMLASGSVGAVAVWLSAPWLARSMKNPELAELVPLYAPYVLFYIASDSIIHVLIAHDRYKRAVVAEMAEAALRAAILLVPPLLTGSVRALVIGVSTYAFLRFAGFWLVVRPRPGWPPRDALTGPAGVAPQIAYGIPLALSTLITLFGWMLDKAIIAFSLGPERYATYAVGAIELPLDTILQGSVANVLRASLPPLARDGNLDEMARLLKAAVRKLSLIIFPAFAFMMAFSHDMIVLAFTPRYVDSVNVFRLYLLLVPLQALVLSPVPQAFGLTRINLAISVGSVPLKAGLSYVLLKTLGYYGPAVGTVITAWVLGVTYFLVMMKLLRRGPAALLPLGRMAATAGVALLAAGISYWVHEQLPYGIPRLAACGALYGVLVLAGFHFARLLDDEDRELVGKLLGVLRPRPRKG